MSLFRLKWAKMTFSPCTSCLQKQWRKGGTYNLNLSEHKAEMLLHCRPPMNFCILHLSPVIAVKWQSPLKRVPGLLPCFRINNIYLSQILEAFWKHSENTHTWTEILTCVVQRWAHGKPSLALVSSFIKWRWSHLPKMEKDSTHQSPTWCADLSGAQK